MAEGQSKRRAAATENVPPAAAFSVLIAFGRDPASTLSIGGLSILERAVRSAQRCGAARVSVVDSERSGSPSGETALLQATADQGVLVLARPALVDPAAIAALTRRADRRSCVTEIRFRDSKDEPPAAYWVTSAAPQLPAAFLDRLTHVPRGAASVIDEAIPPPEGVFERVDSPEAVVAAEAALRRSLVKPTDGFFATWLDRRLSTRWSMRLAGTRLTPNDITVLALVPALAGAVLLAMPHPIWSAAGALLFWLSTVLDGCDGEVARLTFRESPGGARLDLLCDNVALGAVFVAIFVHVYLARPGATVLYLAAATVIGMVGCMATEYFRVLKPRIESATVSASSSASVCAPLPFDAGRVRWYERLASRDFAYVLPFLALLNLLPAFAWATAIGVNVFFAGLTFYVLRFRR